MMIEPPIDELIKKTNGNKYKLCCVVAKRAKELEIRMPNEIEASDEKAISIALKEVVNGEIVPSDQISH